ncbi:MAG: DUF1343 domain-containing protein [Bryobacterales bacterium]|nr:DUF1343 domain-containing protein [Bryobacterales bacterium]
MAAASLGLAFQGQFRGSPRIDAAVEEAIRSDQIPGAVALIWHKGQALHRKAYGHRALTPKREPMTLDTIFDVASLTKVVATAPAIMRLAEQGKLRLNDRVTQHLPEFQGGKSEITIRNLLTHFSGLRPDLDLEPAWSGYETGIRLALADKPVAAPGERFIYSDINYILLGEVVRRVSGRPLNEYAAEVVFKPLGMRWTTFQPPAGWRPRIAPTEGILRGVVHDATARNMGGVSGHAGVFSTADGLARFAEMMIGLGAFRGVRLFSPMTIRRFTAPQSPPDQPVLRGLGWDVDSPYSGPRGDLLPLGSYGHTGFTGTSLWIDPSTETAVILLASSLHPKPRPAITPLRGRIATIVAAALGLDAPGAELAGYNETMAGAGVRRAVARNGQAMTGLDVLVEEKFAALRGKRAGLITNPSGVDREGRRNIDLMREAGVDLRVLFSPEHGLEGDRWGAVPDSRDAATGLPVWSLFSGHGQIAAGERLKGLDALVFDLQDAGARFYTYISTMGHALEEAAKYGVAFYVLDRPNPINGVRVEGPMLETEFSSFVGYHPLPLRHGMTVGELAGLFNAERKIGADLRVIRMRGWERGDWFDSTGLSWVDPSPNLRSLNAALLYPGVALLEYTPDYSVGRGTDAPFEQIGAPWIKGRELAAYLNGRYVPGVRFYATRFRPASSVCAGVLVEGVRMAITGREEFSAQRLGLEIAAALVKLYPGKVSLEANRLLIANRRVMTRLEAGDDPRQIEQESQERVEEFLKVREKYLVY